MSSVRVLLRFTPFSRGHLLPLGFALALSILGCASSPGGKGKPTEPSASEAPAAPAEALTAEDPGWPREISTETSTIVVYQPQVDSWENFKKLEARAAVSVTPKDAEPQIIGSVRFRGDTETDFETRQVRIFNLEITETSFPSLPDAEAPKWGAHVSQSLSLHARVIALDRILAMVELSEGMAKETKVSVKPPPIFVSYDPAVLVALDGDPILAPVKGTSLHFVINTNWALFYDTVSGRYYLLEGDFWLTADQQLENWQPAESLPADFEKLPDEENWAEVKKQLPFQPADPSLVPRVYVSKRPAELIVIDGNPELSGIEDTHLLWMTNTDADLFFFSDTNRYYYLVSGRWFTVESLNDANFEPVPVGELPADFSRIPAGHPAGHVRASIPGTAEAQQAVLQAQIPTKAEVPREGVTLEVTYQGDPEFEQIEGTEVAYTVNSPFDVLLVANRYYVCHEGVWFVSDSPNGPWAVCDAVPQAIYEIPPEEPVYHVTYVHVYESTPTYVVCGYTWGYYGVYTYGGCVVYGTGWYYPPYYYPAPYPIYYGYPYSYGCSAWYNPYTGTYARGASVYGPYGGYGRGAAYNPSTGTYARGAAAWGPSGGTWAAEAYNPRTGAWAGTRQSRNAYEQWGESVVTRGDQWVHSGHYANKDGQAARAWETSEGGKGVAFHGEDGQHGRVARSGDDDLYVGKDGNVYRRDEDGWSKYEDGNWNAAERSGERGSQLSDEQRAQVESRGQEARSRAQESGATREDVQARAQESGRTREDAQARAQESGRTREGARARAQESGRTSGGTRGSASERARSTDRSSRDRSRSSIGSRSSSSSQSNMQRLERDRQARSRANERSKGFSRSRSSGSRSKGSFGGRSRGGGGRRGGGRRR